MPKGAKGCLGNTAQAQMEQSASPEPSHFRLARSSFPLLSASQTLCGSVLCDGLLLVLHGPFPWLSVSFNCSVSGCDV